MVKWKNTLDKGGKVGAFFMDLSKVLYCIKHDLLVAKVHAYGSSRNALLLNSYLKCRFQRFKVNSNFSDWAGLALGVPQGSVLGPLLFDTVINELIFRLRENRSLQLHVFSIRNRFI